MKTSAAVTSMSFLNSLIYKYFYNYLTKKRSQTWILAIQNRVSLYTEQSNLSNLRQVSRRENLPPLTRVLRVTGRWARCSNHRWRAAVQRWSLKWYPRLRKTLSRFQWMQTFQLLRRPQTGLSSRGISPLPHTPMLSRKTTLSMPRMKLTIGVLPRSTIKTSTMAWSSSCLKVGAESMI